MSRKLHNWAFSDVKRFLSDYNFYLSHVKGSHYFYVGSHNKVVRQVCVPFHGSKAIHPRTMSSIIKQSGISQDEWLK